MAAKSIFAIYGASGHGRETMPHARGMIERRRPGSTLVFVDDNAGAESVNGHRVMTYRQFLQIDADERYVNIAIADSTTRRALAERCERDGIAFFSVVADNAVVLDAAEIGEGSILSPFVLLTSNVRIGRHFHANMYSYVAHDSVIGDYVTFAPAVKCNGNVVVEDHAYVGTGAILRNGKPGEPLVIGRGSVVGMGAVVTRSVPAGVTVAGNPARPLRKS